MPSLFLIRHAESHITGVLLGQLDPPLSAQGVAHAASAFGQIGADVVWTSPLRRAAETARFIPSQKIHQLSELREIDQGEWTGKTWAEVETGWPHIAARKSQDWLGVAPPGGEEWQDFLSRVRKAWDVIRAGSAASSTAAVVAHLGVNGALKYLIDSSDPLAFEQAYGEIIRLEYD